MPEEFDPEYDPTNSQEGGETVTLSREQIRALERRPKVDDFNRLQRENVLLKLGVDTDSMGGKLLASNRELPWDKPEEIKAMAEAVGAIKKAEPEPSKTPETTETPPVPAQELQQGQERTNLATGASPDEGKSQRDPREIAVEVGLNAIKKGAREEEAVGNFFHNVAKAAHEGDRRVILTDVPG